MSSGQISIERNGREFLLKTTQELPAPLADVFEFFSDAQNLQKLTPPWLNFSIRTPTPIEMRRGTRIRYRIVIHGVPIHWESEIAEWDPPRMFVDQQLRGPYQRWYHRHEFAETSGGTVVTDAVEYRPIGGRFIHELFVRRDLEKIFSYRQQQLKQVFPERPPTQGR